MVTRAAPQERVLGACKTADDWPDIGPEDGFSTCYRVCYCYEPGCAALTVS